MWLLVVLITNTANLNGGFALDSQRFDTKAQCEKAADQFKSMDTMLTRIKTSCTEIK